MNKDKYARRVGVRNRRLINELTDVSMPVIFDTVLTEPTNAITISVDNYGNAFSLKRADFNILVPEGCSTADGVSANVNARINDIAIGYLEPWMGYGGPYMLLGFARNSYAMIRTKFNVFCGGFTADFKWVARDMANSYTIATNYAGKQSGVDSITKLYVWLTSDYTLPTGTTIELRGQKA